MEEENFKFQYIETGILIVLTTAFSHTMIEDSVPNWIPLTLSVVLFIVLTHMCIQFYRVKNMSKFYLFLLFGIFEIVASIAVLGLRF